MHSRLIFAGWLLIAVGVLFIVKPNIFRRGIWKETDIAQRLLSNTRIYQVHAIRRYRTYRHWTSFAILGL